MLRYTSYDIVFQEIPGEVTLAVNLSNCPNRCTGCHSPYLQEDNGEELNEEVISGLLQRYGNAITCFCFMGGDAVPDKVEQLALFLREESRGLIKSGWYSGREKFPSVCSVNSFDYIKLGAYIEELGGLDMATTNQRFYRTEEGEMVDITDCFQKGKKN